MGTPAAVMHRAIKNGGSIMDSAVAAATAASAALAAATRCWSQKTPCNSGAVCQSNSTDNPSAMPNAPVLLLAQALAEPELGSPQMPSVGSTGHRSGTCKPCAFYHTKGCGNGVECGFCHLCPAGEKKRRQKEKNVAHRSMHCAQTQF